MKQPLHAPRAISNAARSPRVRKQSTAQAPKYITLVNCPNPKIAPQQHSPVLTTSSALPSLLPLQRKRPGVTRPGHHHRRRVAPRRPRAWQGRRRAGAGAGACAPEARAAPAGAANARAAGAQPIMISKFRVPTQNDLLRHYALITLGNVATFLLLHLHTTHRKAETRRRAAGIADTLVCLKVRQTAGDQRAGVERKKDRRGSGRVRTNSLLPCHELLGAQHSVWKPARHRDRIQDAIFRKPLLRKCPDKPADAAP